jgi:hypothetical protein
MPFTLAHPAIVLPLGLLPKKWISMTALIVGSIMPDVESFLRTYSEKELTHSWTGFFYFGLPFGILLTFIFHNIVRNPFVTNLPGFLQQRFFAFTKFNWNQHFFKNWYIIIISLVIGGASHFLWDSFSEWNGWFIRLFPVLDDNIEMPDGSLWEIPYLIQYINTVIGILIIIIVIAKLPRTKTVVVNGGFWKFWTSIVLIGLIIFIARMIYLPRNDPDDLIILITSALSFGLIIVSTFFSKISRVRIQGSRI